jgi:hypothetical protein
MKKRNPVEQMLDGAINSDQKEFREKMEKAKCEIILTQPLDNLVNCERDYLERLAR